MLNTHMTMYEAFAEVAEARRKQLAMVCGEARFTYGELLDRTQRLAMGLQAQGIHKGDRVVVLLSPGPDFATLFFALAAMGGVFVPLNPQLRSRSLGQVLQDADPVMLVVENLPEEGSLLLPPSLKHIIFSAAGVGEPRSQPDQVEESSRNSLQPSSTPAIASPTLDDLVALGSLDFTPNMQVTS